MKEFTHYDPTTGAIIGHFSASTDESVAANVTAARPAVPGRHDHLTKRVDLKTLQVIDHVHEPSALERRHAALSNIESLEAKQPRAIREALLLGTPESLERLKTLDAQIATLRSELA